LIDAAPVHSTVRSHKCPSDCSRSPTSSVLLHRISHRDRSRMPPIGSLVPDPVGVELIRRWIERLNRWKSR
jgi:hypothetical protein